MPNRLESTADDATSRVRRASRHGAPKPMEIREQREAVSFVVLGSESDETVDQQNLIPSRLESTADDAASRVCRASCHRAPKPMEIREQREAVSFVVLGSESDG